MKVPVLTREKLLYLAAFALALALRLIQLDRLPLSDPEADLALRALALARGEDAMVGSQPALALLTTAIFYLFKDTTAAARALPALAGSLLVLSPALFRRQLGRIPALLMAFFLALDPGLTAISRQASSALLAITPAVYALGLALQGRWIGSAFCLGLALLGGPGIWFGALVGLLAAALARPSVENGRLLALYPRDGTQLRYWLAVLLGTLLLGGSLFVILPQGLGAVFNSLVAFLGDLIRPSGRPAVEMVMAVVGYVPLALVFGGLHAVRSSRWEAVDRFLALAWVIGLVAAVVMPGRDYTYLAWTSLPLWALAARWLVEFVDTDAGESAWALGHAALILVLLAFMWMNAAGLTQSLLPETARARWIGIAGVAALLLLTLILVAWGWSLRVARTGLAGALAVFLFLYGLSATFGAAGLGAHPENQLWRMGPLLTQADLIVDTVQEVSIWEYGHRYGVQAAVVDVDSPALVWLLRDQGSLLPDTVLSPDQSPDVIFTPVTSAAPSLEVLYRGQSLVLTEQPDWTSLRLSDWMKWMIFRRAPAAANEVILWAKGQMFPGSAGFPAGS